jgi:integrase
MPKKLSVRAIEDARKSAAGRETMMTDAKVPSLFVRIHPSGIASYVFRYRGRGRVFKTTLGRTQNLTLDDARSTAQKYVGRIALGFDPIAEEKAKDEENRAKHDAARRARAEAANGEAFTVGALIKAWAAARPKDENRSPGYVAQIRKGLERTFEPVLKLRARDLSRDRVEELIEEAEERRGPAAALRAQVAIGLAFKRAIRAGKLEINPCAGLEPRRLKPRARTLAGPEIQRVWRAALTLPPPFGNYVRFLLATGVRRNEALRARWSEIEGDLWHIPEARMKGKRPFTVPLTRAALRTLPARTDGSFIFSTSYGAKPIGGTARIKAALDAAIKADGDGPLVPWTFHDFRRSFATWAADRGFDLVMIDLCLGHALPLSSVGKTYQRSQKITERNQILEAWGAFLDPESAKDAPSLRLVSSS